MLTCPDCGGRMALIRSGEWGPFFRCENHPECHATHGAHPDGTPLGEPADNLTRQARVEAHAAFDAIWKDAPLVYGPEVALDPEKTKKILRIARARCYRWLSERMGVDEAHIGAMDREQCARVVRETRGVSYADVRTWAKGGGDG